MKRHVDKGDMDSDSEPLMEKQTVFSHKKTDEYLLQPKIPYRSICLAVTLFVGGTILIVFGILLLLGIIIPAQYADRTWPVLILGSIMFIPGAYHTYLAYYAYKGYPGYSFLDLPEFDS